MGCRDDNPSFFYVIFVVRMLKKAYLCSLVMKLPYSISDLEHAIAVLEEGGVILYPTDTVWGIGCDATNKDAVARVYNIKEREDSKSMLVLVESQAQLARYTDIPKVAREWRESGARAVHKPTTIIYPEAHGLAQNLLAQDGSIGIRITGEVFSQELCRRLGKPIVSTSANISGRPTPHYYKQIDKDILERVDYICRYKREDENEAEPSRIIKLNPDNTITIIRE